MSKGAQCRKAACQNAGERIDQGAVEVEKNRASHDPKITAKANEYKFVWFGFCFCEKPHNERIQNLSCKRIQCDE
jgi:hypothetical protein